MPDAAPAARGVYKPRRPQASPLFRLVSDHLHRLQTVYDDRFAREVGTWRSVVAQVAEKFLACGAVLRLFVRLARFDEDQAAGMMTWPHSGFLVHTAVWVSEDDRAFATRLARYCARNPVALERLTYDRILWCGQDPRVRSPIESLPATLHLLHGVCRIAERLLNIETLNTSTAANAASFNADVTGPALMPSPTLRMSQSAPTNPPQRKKSFR